MTYYQVTGFSLVLIAVVSCSYTRTHVNTKEYLAPYQDEKYGSRMRKDKPEIEIGIFNGIYMKEVIITNRNEKCITLQDCKSYVF